jgi:hypothetical protein
MGAPILASDSIFFLLPTCGPNISLMLLILFPMDDISGQMRLLFPPLFEFNDQMFNVGEVPVLGVHQTDP